MIQIIINEVVINSCLFVADVQARKLMERAKDGLRTLNDGLGSYSVDECSQVGSYSVGALVAKADVLYQCQNAIYAKVTDGSWSWNSWSNYDDVTKENFDTIENLLNHLEKMIA